MNDSFTTDAMCRAWRVGFSVNDQDAFIRTLGEIRDLPETGD